MNLDVAQSVAPRDEEVQPIGLVADGADDAGHIGMARPSLAWRLRASRDGVRQVGYQLQVARDASFERVLVTTDYLPSSLCRAPAWPGAPLTSRETCWVRVRVQTDRGVSCWSTPLRLEAALLARSDWQARPISPVDNADRAEPGPVPLLRRAFHVDRPVARARLYVSALGVQTSWINGSPVGDALLDPGWTAYHERLLYAAHDVTEVLKPGENVLSAAVGDGWWRGWLTWMERRAVYGATTAYLAQLEIEYVDGTTVIIATADGTDWRGSTGAVRRADLYDGCTIDLRAETEGWRLPGFDDAGWGSIVSLPLPSGLELRSMPPVRVVSSWDAEAVPVGAGRWLVDVGQNLAGWLTLRVEGPAGATVVVRHAEMLGSAGALYTAPLRNADATDSYVLAGTGAVNVEPVFTFHGFRYAEIVADEGVTVERVGVRVISSDLQRTGTFRCSDDRVNRLYENVRWSQIANFLALPTDCPQRDERLGWTGDIQVFADTACMNADAGAFLRSWLKDLSIEQRDDGNVPSTVPNVIGGHEFEYGGVGWGDAATLVPWSLYEATGDIGVLEQQFGSMRRWVDWGASRRDTDGLWKRDFHLGDWLDPGAPSDEPQKATTDPNFIATAYLSRSAAVVSKAATLLKQAAVAAYYEALSVEVARTAWSRWKDEIGKTQAGCAIALQFGIVPSEEVAATAAALARLVNDRQGRIATGFLGTPLVLPALSEHGHTETAYRLLLNEECPGWLYQVRQGATTMWERWDAVGENGRLHAGEMSAGGGSSMISFNHYAYGAVAAWLYRSVAGIASDPAEPGYGHVVFAPQPGGGLNHAAATMETVHGCSGIAWQIDANASLGITLSIAPGSHGTFHVPSGWKLEGVNAEASVILFGSGKHAVHLTKCVSREQAVT
ncbi:hypothetical protein ASE90_16800 [Sphingomonas sp. Leaf67]|uniref:alpha-L-rhamnosidase n=1 Tax=Sphingomonas sp. Leaf67 TaxID=1736230 RepID=UPI0006F23385|nr:alpha-L-rhamnosidase [Sphingomonas sp. Leaf67]KQN90754.1 hypothetical protein ASE90_16800 [Sphingomonas sp. Leaf67]